MKCPRCGEELKRSKKNPEYGLCDNCKKRFLLKDRKIDYLYKNEVKKEKIRKQNAGCAVFAIAFVAIIAVIIGIAIVSVGGDSGDDKASNTDQEQDANVDFESNLDSQKTALYSLIEKYESGEESAGTSSERLSGLADGIQNTINMMNGVDGTDELVKYATALKGVASHYGEYIKTGDQSELDDANKLMETIE